MAGRVIETKRALISVSDKRGMKKFAAALSDLGIELIATEGTAREISRDLAPVTPVTPVSELTGFAELLDGGIKTLHPAVHAAIATSNITIVVVNLIPLTTIEGVDIGGVALLKSAMKNVRNVAAVTDPAQYDDVIREIGENGDISYETRLKFAIAAADYIVDYESRAGSVLREMRGVFRSRNEME